MNVSIEEINTVKKRLIVEIPVDLVSKEIDSAYEALKKKAKIKGFRPGKAPRRILEMYFKDYVKTEVIQKLIENTYERAISEKNLQPVSPPLIDPGELEGGKSFQYSAIIEVKPEIQIEGYLGLKLKQNGEPVREEDIEQRLNNLQNLHANLKTIEEDRPIKDGDYVIIDYEAKENGKQLEDGKAINFSVEIGKGQFFLELEQKLIGMKIGEERHIEVSIPKDYGYKNWAGKTASFNVKIKEIKEKVLPPLDDEFAKDVGGYSTLEELKARIREDMERERELEWKQKLREEIMDQLIENNKFEVPEAMIERQTRSLASSMKVRINAQGLTLKDMNITEDELVKEFSEVAKRQVRMFLILEKIAQKEGLNVSEEEIEERIRDISERMNQKFEVMKRYYEKNDLISELKNDILIEKTLNFLLEKAEIQTN